MTLEQIIDNLIEIMTSLVPLIIGSAVLVFAYGLFGYMTNVGDEGKRADSRKYIVYGLIGLFVMVSLWGLVNLFTDVFNFKFGVPTIKVK